MPGVAVVGGRETEQLGIPGGGGGGGGAWESYDSGCVCLQAPTPEVTDDKTSRPSESKGGGKSTIQPPQSKRRSDAAESNRVALRMTSRERKKTNHLSRRGQRRR